MSVDRLTYNVLCGPVPDMLALLPEVHCIVTSPPYFRKRKYGTDASEIGKGSLDQYLDALVSTFDAIPLAPWGSCWVNLGDTRPDGGLAMVPERFAIAMCDTGWSLIDNVIWAKIVDLPDGEVTGGCMIEPAPRRLNGNGYEYLYRFVRETHRKKAWADEEAVALERQEAPVELTEGEAAPNYRYLPKDLMEAESHIQGRRLHNVWQVKMGQTKKKHYSVFPTTLCERPIAMTCPMWVNPDGTPRSRITEKVEYDEGRGSKRTFGKYTSIEEGDVVKSGRMDTGRHYVAKKPVTTGWTGLQDGWSPGIVLDPFAGSGTTGEVALKLGRSFIGIELYPEYAAMATTRCEETVQMLVDKGLDPFELAR